MMQRVLSFLIPSVMFSHFLVREDVLPVYHYARVTVDHPSLLSLLVFTEESHIGELVLREDHGLKISKWWNVTSSVVDRPPDELFEHRKLSSDACVVHDYQVTNAKGEISHQYHLEGLNGYSGEMNDAYAFSTATFHFQFDVRYQLANVVLVELNNVRDVVVDIGLFTCSMLVVRHSSTKWTSSDHVFECLSIENSVMCGDIYGAKRMKLSDNAYEGPVTCRKSIHSLHLRFRKPMHLEFTAEIVQLHMTCTFMFQCDGMYLKFSGLSWVRFCHVYGSGGFALNHDLVVDPPLWCHVRVGASVGKFIGWKVILIQVVKSFYELVDDAGFFEFCGLLSL